MTLFLYPVNTDVSWIADVIFWTVLGIGQLIRAIFDALGL